MQKSTSDLNQTSKVETKKGKNWWIIPWNSGLKQSKKSIFMQLGVGLTGAKWKILNKLLIFYQFFKCFEILKQINLGYISNKKSKNIPLCIGKTGGNKLVAPTCKRPGFSPHVCHLNFVDPSVHSFTFLVRISTRVKITIWILEDSFIESAAFILKTRLKDIQSITAPSDLL